MTAYTYGAFQINFYSKCNNSAPKVFYFYYNDQSVVGDVIKKCELETGIDMYDYELYAEYPIDPCCAYPTDSDDFKVYDAMPPRNLDDNFVRVIMDAQAMSARQHENRDVAGIIQRESSMHLIHINISHREATFRV